MVPSPCSISRQSTPRQPRSAARPSPTGPPPTIRIGVSWIAAGSETGIDGVDEAHDARADITRRMHLVHDIADGEAAIGIAHAHGSAHARLAEGILPRTDRELRRVQKKAERLAVVAADDRLLRPILLGARGIERRAAEDALAVEAAAIGKDRIEACDGARIAMAVRRRDLRAAEFRRVVIERHRPLPSGAGEHRVGILRRLLAAGDEFGAARKLAGRETELKIDTERLCDLVAIEFAEALAGDAADDLAHEETERPDVIGGLCSRRPDRRLRGERLGHRLPIVHR